VDKDSLGDDYKRMGENANRIFDTLESKVKELGGARSIIENVPVGIVTYKADDPERKWSRVNSTMERITGYGINEMLGKKIESQPFNTDKATKIIEEQREKYDEMPAFEIPWITKGGFHIVVRINVGTIKDESGKVTEYIFVIEDVTQ
jgi:PAS domain S-box-containing protein